jgi:tight adherence protein B
MIVLADFVGSPASRYLIAASAFAATACTVVTLSFVFGKREARLERRLAGYNVHKGGITPIAEETSDSSHVVQQVGAAAERMAGAGTMEKVEQLLEQAKLPLRPAEFLVYAPLMTIVVAALVYLVFGPVMAIVATVVVLASPFLLLKRRSKSRLRKFQEQLPDSLNLLAGSMRAGFSFMQGLEAVADEASEPIRGELQRAFTESRLGRPIEEALDDAARRMESRDLAWAVMAIRIQREVGGNLAELLDTVSETMTHRERLRREIKSLTAEGRMSAIVLSIFPPAFAAMLYILQPGYMNLLFQETIGIICVIGGVILSVIGWFWLSRIVKIEV